MAENTGMLTLYYAPNTCALASHIALEEAGADYQALKVDFSANEQRGKEYLEVNPKGRVPALVTTGGVLTETPAILAYIAQTHPDAGLAPLGDAFEFARLQSFAAYLCSTVHVAHAHRFRGYRWADEETSFADMRRKVPETMTACFELIEAEMLEGPWVLGPTYSFADPYLFTIAEWLEGDGVDVSRLPKVMEHRRRMTDRPAVRAALAAERG